MEQKIDPNISNASLEAEENKIPKSNRKRNIIIIISVAAVIVIAVVVVLLVVLLKKDDDDKKNNGTFVDSDNNEITNEQSNSKNTTINISGTSISYSTANLITTDQTISRGEFISKNSKETVFLVVNGTLTLEQGVIVTKTDSTRRLDDNTPPQKPEGDNSPSNQSPNSSGQAPTGSNQPPNSSGQAPASSNQPPNSSGQAPTSSNQPPNSSGQAPNGSNKPPSSSGQAPPGNDQPQGGGGTTNEADSYSFYGINSAIVVIGANAKAIINGATITTNSYGANAVVAVNSGTIEIKNSIISTEKDSSRGIHATYKGVINANNVTITTKGGSCANIATDRGEGTITANNMKLSTAGSGSPLIYSTGSITVNDSTGSASGAQIVVVEGKNSAKLTNCQFTCTGNGNRGDVDIGGVMVYQSMSGDAEVGQGTFESSNSSLTILSSSSYYSKAPMFFITNTKATITLKKTDTSFGSGIFAKSASTDQWGTTGKNGGEVTLTVTEKTISGKLYADNISNIIFKHDSNVKSTDYSTEGNITSISIS